MLRDSTSTFSSKYCPRFPLLGSRGSNIRMIWRLIPWADASAMAVDVSLIMALNVKGMHNWEFGDSVESMDLSVSPLPVVAVAAVDSVLRSWKLWFRTKDVWVGVVNARTLEVWTPIISAHIQCMLVLGNFIFLSSTSD